MTYIPRSCRKHLWIKNRNNLLKYDFPLILFLILLSACSKEDIQIIQQSNSNKIFVTYQESKIKLPNGNSCALIAINQHFNDSTDFGAIFGNKEHTINKNFDFQNLFLIKKSENFQIHLNLQTIHRITILQGMTLTILLP